MVWTLATISGPADCTLDAWSVFEVPFDGVVNAWTQHFIGFKRESCTGQVSSPIEQLDAARRRGRTRSGKVYELAGRPGMNSDALATWGQWKRLWDIQHERDITADVEGLLHLRTEAVRRDADEAGAVASRVQRALRGLRYWDERSDLSMQGHRRHDLRSLALHEAAVRRLQERPELARRALDVLARWEALGDAHSRPLLAEWRRIIEVQDWQMAIERSDRGQQLRQASPLAFVLDETERDAIHARFRRSLGGR